jgi:competence protein ComEA
VLYLGGCGSDRAITFNGTGTNDVSTAYGTETQNDSQKNDSSSERAALSTESENALKEPEIYVYVCGEVKKPGVYTLPKGSRADDALNSAGGFTDNADTEYVNLAAKVNDGDRLYFPDKEEALTEREKEEAEMSGLVNINTADETLLCTLPGIGSARAKDIISYRESHGDFETKEDIMNVSGIKDAAYSKICDKITVK